jgi:hypothetical protein
MLKESLLALAALAGRMVVEAAATDQWETVQPGYDRLLGRGDTEQTRLTERRLQETREQLSGTSGMDLGLVRTALAIRWTGRLTDLLEEHPDAEADMRALVQRIQAVLRAETLLAPSHTVPVNADVSTDADGMVAGPEHPGALAARSDLAYSIGQAGDAGAARDQFAALLLVRERVCGPEHAETLAVWYQLAHWTALAADTDSAPR